MKEEGDEALMSQFKKKAYTLKMTLDAAKAKAEKKEMAKTPKNLTVMSETAGKHIPPAPGVIRFIEVQEVD